MDPNMPQIIIQANPPGEQSADVTLQERVVAAHFDSPHYAAQLIERLAWATADAEAIESQPRRRPAGNRRSASRATPASASRDLGALAKSARNTNRPAPGQHVQMMSGSAIK
jgi:hypothetical protein